MSKRATVHIWVALALVQATSVAWAAPYCCPPCKEAAQQTIDVSNDFRAGIQCTALCKHFTIAQRGACEQPAAPTQAPAPASPPAANASGSSVLVYKSADCSGDGLKLDKSNGRLEAGVYYSFAVESGGPASVFAQPDFAGSRTAPVGPTICVAPNFSISAVRIGME
jgi:hypothetical protein